jgi:3-hydroxyacyl-[acyl-carrier-protein] dehydratase
MSELNIKEILDLLPHRYPFILLDRVLLCEPGVRVRALKNVTINEPYFTGHFPAYPVMPGVLILEIMAQAMAVLAIKTIEAEGNRRDAQKIFYFAGVDAARFKKPVIPGDQLIIEIKLIKIKSDVIKAEASVFVQDDLVCSAELMGAYKGT